MGRQRRRGSIQNEEVLIEVLYGESFFIPCKDKKDAHSKGVSLNNAKNSRMSSAQQKKIRVQEVELDGEWGVKVFPAIEIPIYRIVEGKKVLWNAEEDTHVTAVLLGGKSSSKSRLNPDNQRILELMLQDKKEVEEIVSALDDEKMEDVLEEMARVKEALKV